MKKRTVILASALAALLAGGTLHAQNFELTSSGYFKNRGVDVMAFDDIYPEGHQGGVCIIMNGHRVPPTATSGWKPRPDSGSPCPASSTASWAPTASPPRYATPTRRGISPDLTP